jgi:hypothetical protein
MIKYKDWFEDTNRTTYNIWQKKRNGKHAPIGKPRVSPLLSLNKIRNKNTGTAAELCGSQECVSLVATSADSVSYWGREADSLEVCRLERVFHFFFWKKIWFFSVKSWFFTRNTPKIVALPSARRNFFSRLTSVERPYYMAVVLLEKFRLFSQW